VGFSRRARLTAGFLQSADVAAQRLNCGMARRYPGWHFSAARWHPRFRIGASRVAPVRGGTYFSLQRQRKVGKRKPLQTSGARQNNATAHGL
jgi:hypothetical protein